MKRLRLPQRPQPPPRPPLIAPGPLQSPMGAARTQQPSRRLQSGRVAVGDAAQPVRVTQSVSTTREPAFRQRVPQPGGFRHDRGQCHAHETCHQC